MGLRLSVGIVGGSGWIGRSLVDALLRKKIEWISDISISNTSGINPFPKDWPDIRVFAQNQGLADIADVLILSVRPEQFEALAIDASRCLVISMMAGLSISDLKAATGTSRIIRAMPNAAIEIGEGYIPWCASAEVSQTEKSLARALFSTVGGVDEVPDEPLLDYLTGLSGTGPAYPALLAQSLLDHACARGLPADIAARAVNAVVVGASQMLRTHSSTELVDSLMGYQGVTAAGLTEMISRGFKSAVAAGLDEAELKALQMTKS